MHCKRSSVGKMLARFLLSFILRWCLWICNPILTYKNIFGFSAFFLFVFVFVLDSPKYDQAEPFPEVAVLKPQGIVKNLEFQGESSSELQASSTSQNLCTIDVRSAFLRVPSSRFWPNKRRCFLGCSISAWKIFLLFWKDYFKFTTAQEITFRPSWFPLS